MKNVLFNENAEMADLKTKFKVDGDHQDVKLRNYREISDLNWEFKRIELQI